MLKLGQNMFSTDQVDKTQNEKHQDKTRFETNCLMTTLTTH